MNIGTVQFWFLFICFPFIIFLAFFIPGDLIVRKLRVTSFQRIVISTIVGMILWGWQGIILGYLGLRFLSYVYLGICICYWILLMMRKNTKNSFRFPQFRIDILLAFLIVLGVLVQVVAVWFTGILYTDGLYFCCGNITDNLFHIALTNQLIKHFPPYQPGMYGVFVQNYHYWSNMVVADLNRVFSLPLIATQFQYMSIFLSLFLGLSIVVFGQMLQLKKAFTAWLLFFIYFGGDFLMFVMVALGKGFNFSMSSLEDGSKFLVNPPRAFSVVIFFVGLSLFLHWLQKKDRRTGLVMALLFGTVIGFKVYTGVFVLCGLIAVGIFFVIRKKFQMLVPLITTVLFSFLVYMPVNAGAGGLYFTRFSQFERFIVEPELGLIRWDLARRIFEQDKKWLRVFQYELMFMGLYIFSLFGSKLLGVFQTRASLRLFPKELHIFLLSGLLVSSICGFFFQQTSGAANTFNFVVSVFIFGSLYTSLACYFWMGRLKKPVKLFVMLFIVGITFPRVSHELYLNTSNLIQKNGLTISNNELAAMNYLKHNTDKDSLILVYHKGSLLWDKETPYMSFLADRHMFFSGKGILESHGIAISQRLHIVQILDQLEVEKEVRKTFLQQDIDYIVMHTTESLSQENFLAHSNIVYKNATIKILRVSQ